MFKKETTPQKTQEPPGVFTMRLKLGDDEPVKTVIPLIVDPDEQEEYFEEQWENRQPIAACRPEPTSSLIVKAIPGQNLKFQCALRVATPQGTRPSLSQWNQKALENNGITMHRKDLPSGREPSLLVINGSLDDQPFEVTIDFTPS